MLNHLMDAFAAQRILLVGSTGALTQWMQALLSELGARVSLVSPDTSAEGLYRALSAGRIRVVIVPEAHMLSPSSLLAQLSRLSTLLTEVREAGVPLLILCSDVNVYHAQAGIFRVREEHPIGGENAQGLTQSILQLYAQGAARGLLGDAISTLIVRHMPCLSSGHPLTVQYTRWCQSLLSQELIEVEHPGRQGVFVHPLDIAFGTLLLGAYTLLSEVSCPDAYNLGVGSQNLCANRSAALRLIRRHDHARPMVTLEPPQCGQFTLLDGSRARLLCGVRCLLGADEALDLLLDALRDPQQSILRQTRHYLEQLHAL